MGEMKTGHAAPAARRHSQLQNGTKSNEIFVAGLSIATCAQGHLRNPYTGAFRWALLCITCTLCVSKKTQQPCNAAMTLEEMHQKANQLQDREDNPAALKCLNMATSLFPHRAETWYALGQLLHRERELDEAARALEDGVRALAKDNKRGVASLLSMLGQVQEERGEHSKAEEAYRASTAMEPNVALTWYNQGYFMMTQNNYDEALKAFLRAVELRPDFGRAVEAAGAIYFGSGEEEKSIPYFYNAVRLLPREVSTRLNLANALGKTEKHTEAVQAYREVLKLEPTHADAASKLAYFSLQVCDWKDYNAYVRRVLDIVRADLRDSKPTTLIPFNALIMPISIQDQLAIAQSHARRHSAIVPLPHTASTQPSVSKRPLRVGYFSADFRNHPMGRDLSVLLPSHSAASVTVFCYAQNPPHPVHDGAYRAKFETGVHRFADVNPLSDQEAAAVMRGDELDVAIDLMGYTHGGRDGIFAHHPSKVQIAFKGYMSTSGSTFIGHLVSDVASVRSPRTAIAVLSLRLCYAEDDVWVQDACPRVPVELAGFYSERQLLIDPCFVAFTHPVNHPEVLSAGVVPRSVAGLPEQGFLFCSFNSLYKITPSTFLAWVKILNAVPGSLLWLLREPAEAEPHLLKFAQERGLHASRIRFTDKVNMSQHLLHKGNCDLFLDTPLYNAHSTAADALWAGIPMVTVAREKMASRVAASLALALHLPQMVARTLEEYVALAVQLATRPRRLQSLRAALMAARGSADALGAPAGMGAVFDLAAWMASYERGLRLAVELQRRSKLRFHIVCQR